MVRHVIKTIRRQPKHTRNNIAFGIASVFTALVFAVWAYHLPTRLSDMAGPGDDAAETAGVFSQIFDQFGEQVAAVKESIPRTQPEEPATIESLSVVSVASGSSSAATTTVDRRETASSSTNVRPEPSPDAPVVRIVAVPVAATSSDAAAN